MPVLAWFIFCTLSRRRVRLPINWVNAEWDSTSTEGTNIYEDFTITSTQWLSWHGVSLRVDSVDGESHLAFTQLTGNETPCQPSHCWILKNLNKSANSRSKSKTLKSLIIWPIQYMFDQYKKPEQKISCKCTLNHWESIEKSCYSASNCNILGAEKLSLLEWTLLFAKAKKLLLGLSFLLLNVIIFTLSWVKDWTISIFSIIKLFGFCTRKKDHSQRIGIRPH